MTQRQWRHSTSACIKALVDLNRTHNMNANHPIFAVAPLPQQLLLLPFGSWGISYDISTNKTQHNAPNGWYAWRSNAPSGFPPRYYLIFITGATYRALIRQLLIMGFRRHQYSDYRADNISGANAWFAAFLLKLIDPPMKLETTLLGLKVHHYPQLNLLDMTDFMRIGGILSRQLRGPIPASLLPPGMMIVGMNGGIPVPPVNFQLPKYSRVSPESLNPNNWRR